MPTGTNKVDLAPRHRAALLALIGRHAPGAEVWAFGSRVRGGGHSGSDLDLVLRNPQDLELPIPGRNALIAAVQDSALPMLVEIHDRALLPADFRTEIQRRYAPLTPESG